MNRCAARGFTLVEVLASIVIIGMIGALAGAILHRGVEGYQGTVAAAHLHQRLASAMDRVDRALREIPPVEGTSLPDIKGVSATSIDWETADGASGLAAVDGVLTLAMDGGDPMTLLTGVSQFQIRCFDGNNGLLASTLSAEAAESVRRIEVTLTATEGELSDTLRTRIFLRCTMSGSDE